jgi:hypothetical protein
MLEFLKTENCWFSIANHEIKNHTKQKNQETSFFIALNKKTKIS